MIELVVLAGVAVLAGATASIAGAGIGSMLTPLLSLRLDFKIAVALVAIPHILGGAVRAARLRRHLDWRTIRRFGVACALASLAGAFLHQLVTSVWLTRIFGGLLIVAGLLGLAGTEQRLAPGKKAAWVGGAVAGLTGGLVGEQGGIRAVALLGFRLPRDAFVATSAAIGVVIDLVRAPVYLVLQWDDVREHLGVLALAAGGVVVGTGLGLILLRHIPEKVFSKLVAAIVIVVAVLLLLRPGE